MRKGRKEQDRDDSHGCTCLQGQVGPDEHVICALSGGVDSTVAATLVHKALGDRLHCVFVDNGLLRYKGVRTYSSLKKFLSSWRSLGTPSKGRTRDMPHLQGAEHVIPNHTKSHHTIPDQTIHACVPYNMLVCRKPSA
eukprot:1157898-Pelagomonas_calceolata.AAC.14